MRFPRHPETSSASATGRHAWSSTARDTSTSTSCGSIAPCPVTVVICLMNAPPTPAPNRISRASPPSLRSQKWAAPRSHREARPLRKRPRHRARRSKKSSKEGASEEIRGGQRGRLSSGTPSRIVGQPWRVERDDVRSASALSKQGGGAVIRCGFERAPFFGLGARRSGC